VDVLRSDPRLANDSSPKTLMASMPLAGRTAEPPAPVDTETAGTTAELGETATFAEWMSSVLRREGLTQEAAARQLGVSVKTVGRWVGGETEPRLRDLRRIKDLFGELPFPS
jgi:hypothetical protein